MTSMLLQDVRCAERLEGPVTADDLSELIQSFNQVSCQLQATQSALRAEVARLQSELADANAQLGRTRSLAALGEMAAGIAHEIRNPLGSIQLYAQALGDEVGDSVVASGLCDKIARGVRHLDAVVRDVLSFAREMRLQSTQVDAIAVVHRALESCSALLSSHAIQVNISSSRQHQLEGDETLLIQALSNLIRNSVEAMSEANAPRKAITLDVRRAMRRCPDHVARERVIFVVEDSGPGIPADVVDRMFNPFFTTRRTGTGLGLAIVHRIVDAHGGQICVGSADEGTGARIEVCLPPAQRTRPASTSTVDYDTVDDENAENGSSSARSRRQGPEQFQHIGDGTRVLARESHA